MSHTPRSSTETLIKAMRILSVEIQSGDGVANAAIREAAERMERMRHLLSRVLRSAILETDLKQEIFEVLK